MSGNGLTVSALPLPYVLAAQPLFNALRDGLVQVAGFALMRATRPRLAALDFSPVELALQAVAEPLADVEALHVPSAAAHHHYHLKSAGAALKRALVAAGSTGIGSGDVFYAAVEDAERHIRAAGKLLPGFEVVDLKQGCCAMHAAPGFAMERMHQRP